MFASFHVSDSIAALSTMTPKSFDLVIVDPPYNMQIPSGDLLRPEGGGFQGSADEGWDKFRDPECYASFTEEYLSFCRRLMKDRALICVMGSFQGIHEVGVAIKKVGLYPICDITWIKSNPVPNFSGTRLCNSTETIIVAKRGKSSPAFTFNYKQMKQENGGKQMRTDWRFPICSGQERLKEGKGSLHRTQKPEALISRLVSAFSKPGDVVLDPFCGTGTTARVCRNLGRSSVNVDSNAVYIKRSAERCGASQHMLQEFETQSYEFLEVRYNKDGS